MKKKKRSKADTYRSARVARAVAGGLKRLKGGRVTNSDTLGRQLRRLWDRSMGRACPMVCGKILTPKTSAFCHDVALAEGGNHKIGNIYLACGTCNRAQHTLTKNNYLSLRALIIENFGEAKWKKIRTWMAGGKY